MYRVRYIFAAVIAVAGVLSILDFEHDKFVPTGVDDFRPSIVFSPVVNPQNTAIANIPKLGKVATEPVEAAPVQQRTLVAPKATLPVEARDLAANSTVELKPAVLDGVALAFVNKVVAPVSTSKSIPLPVRAPARSLAANVVVSGIDPLNTMDETLTVDEVFQLPRGNVRSGRKSLRKRQRRRAAFRGQKSAQASVYKPQPEPVESVAAPKLLRHREPFHSGGN